MIVTYAEVELVCPCGETLAWQWRGDASDMEDIEAEVREDVTNRRLWGGQWCLSCEQKQRDYEND